MTGTVDVSKLDKNPNEPRQIRARTGMTEDPLPEGKKLEEKQFPKITPAKHDAPDHPDLSKADVQAHNEELRNMQAKDAKHGGESNRLKKTDPISSKAAAQGGRESRTT